MNTFYLKEKKEFEIDLITINKEHFELSGLEFSLLFVLLLQHCSRRILE